MKSIIQEVHPETAEILDNARAAHKAHEITDEQYNEVVRHCFRTEEEYKLDALLAAPGSESEAAK